MTGSAIGYLVPEFPGQTHTWIWRELTWLRAWGTDLRLVSTRPPPARDRARHAFAGVAAAETFYLHDHGPDTQARLLGDLARFCLADPAAVARAARVAAGLPVDGGAAWRRCLPLLAPAARLAQHCRHHGIVHVHCHTCAAGAIVAMLARLLGGHPIP